MNSDLISRSALLEKLRALSEIEPIREGIETAISCVDVTHAADAEPVRHGEWEHIKKHFWYRDDEGDVDMFRVDHDYHNGPECEICGKRFCEHCAPDWAEDKCEIGYYICSECEHPTKMGDSNYCPNCGAKMDDKKAGE